jgi:hypothetical protein
MTRYDQLLEISRKLELENPGKTIVLRTTTLEPHIISDDPHLICSKVKEIYEAGDIPIFIGGYQSKEMCFHMVC